MDSNEEKGKILNRDPFHQVKGINDKKKENTGYRFFAGTRTRAEHKQQGAKSHALWDRNGRRGSYAQKAAPEINQQFRVVRDNRVNQNATTDVIPGSLQNPPKDNHQVASNSQDKSSSGNLIDHKNSAEGNSDGRIICQNLNGGCDSGPSHGIDEKSSWSDKESLSKEKEMTVSNLTRMVPRYFKNKSQAQSETSQSANSAIGVYSSSSDPVHVPTSRSASIAGAIRREVGVVGAQRQSSDHSATCTSNSGNSFIPLSARDGSSRHSTTTIKSNHPNPASASRTFIPSMSTSKSFSASQYDVKLHQQVMGRNKATQPNLEWKAKSSRKPNADSPGVATQSIQVQATGLSEKLLQVNISKNEHVIIPHHLRVPESERAGLMFGSFGTMCDSTEGSASALKAFKYAEDSSNGFSSSISASIPLGSVEDFVADQSGLVDSQVRTSRSDDSASAAEPELPLPVNDESLSPRDIETYPDVGLIHSHNFSSSSHEPQQQKSRLNSSDFSAYDYQMSLDMPFSKMIMEDNAQGQGLSSAHEALSTHATDSSSLSSMSMVQQQQTFTQLYPQVHISNYPNFVPYRQIISPLYVPQLLVANYSNNSAHTYPSSGSNYLMMPGGIPQLNSNSMKYGASQYKPFQAGNPTTGYGTYTNPGGYTVGTIGSTAGMEDVTRFNFKDQNIDVPNPQLDVDNWIQTPRDLASLQSTPCYNLSGQAQPHPAYLPAAHTANPALNPVTFPSPHSQYPGLYHPSQPGSFTGQTNHIVHQQVQSGLAGNPGIGMVPAAATQVGAYQQSQLGHLGWTSNF